MEKKIVNQKEYLKKYLSSGKDKKKAKKKKPNLGTKTVKIIDDDISLKNMRALEDGELDIFNNTEDGPQIAGIVDERGPVDFSDKKRWKIVTDDWDGDITVTRVNRDGRVDDEESSPRNKEPGDEDFSPPRRPRKNSESDDGRKKTSSKKRRSKASSPEDSDFSPPRQSKKGSDSDETGKKKSSKKRRSKPEREDPEDSDLSPPRKAKKDSDSDLSPPRNSKTRGKERRKDKSKHSQKRGDKEDHRSARARSSGRNNPDERDDRRNDRAQKERKRVSRWKDRSPSPRNRRKDDPERSKPRSQRGGRGSDSDLSPPRENRQNSRNLEPDSTRSKKSTSENYQEMSEETTGFGQAPVYRDRKTGRRRDFAAEAREQGEKDEKRQELEEKYAQWGRGLKQVEDRQEKLDRDLYEMSKPLARYADDADLERELKAQDREGDPMLEYMRRKQVKEGKQEPETPKYRGPSMPNRFGIRPGYRWDGVDRSNGYEKKWFEAQNARKAVQEEAYKWSTADM